MHRGMRGSIDGYMDYETIERTSMNLAFICRF